MADEYPYAQDPHASFFTQLAETKQFLASQVTLIKQRQAGRTLRARTWGQFLGWLRNDAIIMREAQSLQLRLGYIQRLAAGIRSDATYQRDIINGFFTAIDADRKGNFIADNRTNVLQLEADYAAFIKATSPIFNASFRQGLQQRAKLIHGFSAQYRQKLADWHQQRGVVDIFAWLQSLVLANEASPATHSPQVATQRKQGKRHLVQIDTPVDSTNRTTPTMPLATPSAVTPSQANVPTPRLVFSGSDILRAVYQTGTRLQAGVTKLIGTWLNPMQQVDLTRLAALAAENNLQQAQLVIERRRAQATQHSLSRIQHELGKLTQGQAAIEQDQASIASQQAANLAQNATFDDSALVTSNNLRAAVAIQQDNRAQLNTAWQDVAEVKSIDQEMNVALRRCTAKVAAMNRQLDEYEAAQRNGSLLLGG